MAVATVPVSVPMISIRRLRKVFQVKKGGVAALPNLDLKVDREKFFISLGPSGSGKSTLLRCIAGIALGERLHRELQCPIARRAPERGDLLHPQGSPGSRRILATPLQRRAPAQQPGIPAAGTRDDRHAKLAARLRYAPPAIQLGRETVNALTFEVDQSPGAGQACVAVPHGADRDGPDRYGREAGRGRQAPLW